MCQDEIKENNDYWMDKICGIIEDTFEQAICEMAITLANQDVSGYITDYFDKQGNLYFNLFFFSLRFFFFNRDFESF